MEDSLHEDVYDVDEDGYNGLGSLLSLDSPTKKQTLEDKVGLYIITPTYPRPEQLPELTRLSQTLMVRGKRRKRLFLEIGIALQPSVYNI